MAATIESRVPFLDTRVVEFAHSLPGHHRQRLLSNKHIFEIVPRRHLPDEVIGRHKSGFGVFLAEWFRPDQSLGRSPDAHSDSPFLDHSLGRETLRRRFEAHRRGDSDQSDLLCTALNVSSWQQRFRIACTADERSAFTGGLIHPLSATDR